MNATPYRLRFETPPCLPGSETVSAILEFDEDISDLLPLINAEFGPGIFDKDMPSLRLTHEDHPLIFFSRKIGIGKCADRQDGERAAQKIWEMLQWIRDHRDQITPSYQTLGRVTALDVFKLLPRTNCRQCDYPTCLAFATAVSQGEAEPEECPPLLEPERDASLAAIRKLLWPEGETD